MRSLTTFQRLALATIAVCLLTFVGTRLVKADILTFHEGDSYEEMTVLEALHDIESLETDMDTDIDIDVEVDPKRHVVMDLSHGDDDVFFERSFPVRGGDELEIQLSSEDVVVETISSGEASVTITGRGRDARTEYERRRFSAAYTNGRLHVRTNPERNRRSGMTRAGFTVTVRVPATLDVGISLSSGDVSVENITGSVSVNASSGDVELHTVQEGPVSVNTSSGDVSAERLEGTVSINTSSGDIELGDLNGDSVSLNSSSGDITARTLEADRLNVNTSSGDIEMDGLDARATVETSSGEVQLVLTRVQALNASTGSGDVEVMMARGSGASLSINSGDIEIDSDLGFRGSRQRRSAEGNLGSGGPALAINTGSGSVVLHAR